jgi:geranylgeranyl pyrophosphate synthase
VECDGAPDDPAPGNGTVPPLDAAADRYLQRLVAAQREALSWQDRSVRAALDAVVAVMQQLGAAVTAISRAHEVERAALQAAATEPPEQPNAQILAQLAPLIASKLLAPAPTPSPAPNGHAPRKTPPGD